MTALKPLMLKDLLEIDTNSDSCDRFRCAPRRPASVNLRRPINALARISAVIKRISSPRSRETFLPRSFSKNLRRGFWWRKEEEKRVRVRVRDIVRLRSFDEDRSSLYFPSPVVSSSSSSSDDGDSSGSDFLMTSCGGSESSAENDAAATASGKDYSDVVAGDVEKEEVGRMELAMCHSEEEKEQLSPVSVMDFPYQGEEENHEEENEASFHQILSNVERSRHHVLRKIRRFKSIAELDPVSLFASFEDPLQSAAHVALDGGSSEMTSASDLKEESGKWAWNLLEGLEGPWGPQCRSIQKLLEDFIAEGLRISLTAEVELLEAARDWISGEDGCAADGRDASVKEMERNGGWRCFEREEEEVAAQLEGRLLGSLLDELVLDLSWC